MFTAFDATETLIFADQLPPKIQEDFYCPGCKEPVFLKRGIQKITHFSHYAHSKCAAFSEGETEEHLQGKRMIYEALQRRNEKVTIEPYINDLKQRPDLLWKKSNGTNVAIEFQCSSLSTKRMIERTEGYHDKKFEVIWILGKNFHLKSRLTAFQKLMVSDRYFKQPIFIQLSVRNKQLQVYQNIRLNIRKQYEFEKVIIPLAESLDEKIMTYHIADSKSENLKMKHYNLEKAQNFNDKYYRDFFSLLYSQQESVISIPVELYQTVGNEWLVRTNPFEWKYRLVLWIESFVEQSVITPKMLKNWLRQQILEGNIQYYDTPMLGAETKLKPFIQFLDQLTKCGSLEKSSKDKWTYRKQLKRFETPEGKKSFLH